MVRQEVSIAEAKAHLSELINRVIYAHEEIVITKRGRPVAVISFPQERREKGLASVKGWLGQDDPFFKDLDFIVEKRHAGKLRAEGHEG